MTKQIQTADLLGFQKTRDKVLLFASNLAGALLKKISSKFGIDPTEETEQVEKELSITMVLLAVALSGIAKLCKIDLSEISKELTEAQITEIKILITAMTRNLPEENAKSLPNIPSYYKQFGIELGNLDFLDGISFGNSFGDTGGSVKLDGKKGNNTMSFNGKMIQASIVPEDTSSLGNQALTEIIQNKMLLIHTVIHELHHRLFNLDSRLNLDGSNQNLPLIPTNIREGCVEYLAQKVSLTTLSKMFSTQTPETIKRITAPNSQYQNYVANIENYLDNLALAMTTQDSKKPKDARLEVEKIFMNFFLSGDRQILDLAKRLDVKNIFQI